MIIKQSRRALISDHVVEQFSEEYFQPVLMGESSVPLLENFKGIMESIGSSLLSHRGEIQSSHPFISWFSPSVFELWLRFRSIFWVIFFDGSPITREKIYNSIWNWKPHTRCFLARNCNCNNSTLGCVILSRANVRVA